MVMQGLVKHPESKSQRNSQFSNRPSGELLQIDDNEKKVNKPIPALYGDRFIRDKEVDQFDKLDGCHTNPFDGFSKSLCALLKPRPKRGNPMEEEWCVGRPLNLRRQSQAKARLLADSLDFSVSLNASFDDSFRQRMVWFKQKPTVMLFIDESLIFFSGQNHWQHTCCDVWRPVSIETAEEPMYYVADYRLKLSLVDSNKHVAAREFVFDQSYESMSQTTLTVPDSPEWAATVLLAKGSSLKLYDMRRRDALITESVQTWRKDKSLQARFFGTHGLAVLNNWGRLRLWDLRNLQQPTCEPDLGNSAINHFDTEPGAGRRLVFSTIGLELGLHDLLTNETSLYSVLDAPVVDLTWRHDSQVSLVHNYPAPGFSTWKINSLQSPVLTERLTEESADPSIDITAAAIWKKGNLAATLGSFNCLDPITSNPNISFHKL